MPGQGAQNHLLIARSSSGGIQRILAAPYVLSRQLTDPGPRRTLVEPAPPAPRRNTPTLVADFETVWNLATEPRTVSVTVLNGDLLIVCAVNADWADSTDDFVTPTGGGLTYTAIQEIKQGSFCGVGVWWARATSDATFNVSTELSGSPDAMFGLDVLVYRGSDGVGNSTQGTDTLAAPQFSFSTNEDRSTVLAVIGDWNASVITSRNWLAVNGFDPDPADTLNHWERVAARETGQYSILIGQWMDVGNAGSDVVGLSVPSSTQYAMVAVEILGELADELVHIDDFADSIFWGFWEEIDPIGDLNWVPQASTMRIIAPSGNEHDWWTGSQESGKLAQYVDPGWTDPLVAKLSAVPDNGVTGASAIYGAGLFIDDGDYNEGIRFEILRWSDDTLKAFAAVFEFGNATGVVDAAVTTDVYLRITKSGISYQFETSTNGTTWTNHGSTNWAGTPSRVGLHLITSGTASTYTQDFDFFGIAAAGGGVTLDGDAENAASASGVFNAERPLTTHADAASSATAAASVERPIVGVGSAANSASASLSVTRDVAASAPVAASASASRIDRAAGLITHADAASDMDGSADVVRGLAGSAPVASSASTAPDVARVLSASANAASGASAELSIQGQVTFAGSAPVAAHATGALSRTVSIGASASAAAHATGDLTVRDTTPALAGSMSAAVSAQASMSITRAYAATAPQASSATADLFVLPAYEPALVSVEGSAFATDPRTITDVYSGVRSGRATVPGSDTDRESVASVVDGRAVVTGVID